MVNFGQEQAAARQAAWGIHLSWRSSTESHLRMHCVQQQAPAPVVAARAAEEQAAPAVPPAAVAVAADPAALSSAGSSGRGVGRPPAPAAAEERVQVSHHVGACVHQQASPPRTICNYSVQCCRLGVSCAMSRWEQRTGLLSTSTAAHSVTWLLVVV
jgi:hypothetical protein